ncbi:hypothetical protein ACB098_07G025500 [Castanea mollissima]
MPTQYLSLGYPSNKWRDVRKAIKASISWGLELPSPKQSLCPPSGNLFLYLHPRHLHTPSRNFTILVSLEFREILTTSLSPKRGSLNIFIKILKSRGDFLTPCEEGMCGGVPLVQEREEALSVFVDV